MACFLLVYFRFRVTMFIHIVYLRFVALILYEMSEIGVQKLLHQNPHA